MAPLSSGQMIEEFAEREVTAGTEEDVVEVLLFENDELEELDGVAVGANILLDEEDVVLSPIMYTTVEDLVAVEAVGLLVLDIDVLVAWVVEKLVLELELLVRGVEVLLWDDEVLMCDEDVLVCDVEVLDEVDETMADLGAHPLA